MKQYIDKDAVVAEIKKLIRENELYLDDNVSDAVRFQKTGAYSVLCDLQHFLNTLEVKEEDLGKEEERIWKGFNMGECHLSKNDFEKISKHFFDLGMAVSNKQIKEKDV